MEKINTKTMAVPSGSGAKIIQVVDNKNMVGGSEKSGSLEGLKNMVPDGSKK